MNNSLYLSEGDISDIPLTNSSHNPWFHSVHSIQAMCPSEVSYTLSLWISLLG